MPKALEFWFDLSSPYAFFAALQVESLGARHGRCIAWRPFLLGVAFRQTSMAALTQQPLRGDYARRDWARLARRSAVPFELPSEFPLRTQAPARLVYAVESVSPEFVGTYARALFRAAFSQGSDIGSAEVAVQIGADIGLDPRMLLAATAAERWREALRARTAEAISRGVFGAPFFFIDGEPFWGADRMAEMDDWLSCGGW